MDDIVYRKLLLMVNELHRRGYQRLRIVPGMSPCGEHWRCSITPVTNVSVKHGARLVEWEHLTAHYTSADGAKYFGWTYAGWYQEMLGLTFPNLLPIAYREEGCPQDKLLTIGPDGETPVIIPLPPPGVCVEAIIVGV